MVSNCSELPGNALWCTDRKSDILFGAANTSSSILENKWSTKMCKFRKALPVLQWNFQDWKSGSPNKAERTLVE